MKIRKALSLALAAILMSASALAAPALENVESASEAGNEIKAAELNADITSELVFYQDFDNLPLGTYTSGQITSMLSGHTATLVDYGKMGWGVLGSGCTFEVCEETDGNRYLKVTGSQYNAFGVWLANDATDYLYAAANYMYPDTEQTGLNEVTYKAKGTVIAGSQENGTTGNWATSGAITDTSKTTWTQVRCQALVTSPCAGWGFNQKKGGATSTVYIDDLAVYSFSGNVNVAHNSSVKATIKFKNSTAYAADSITMPTDVSAVVWCNYYNAQNGKTHTLNLNNYKPTGAPDGMEFAGWSLTDGGKAIHSVQASSFRVPGDLTFYAVWEKAKPVVKVEDFEKFEVGKVLGREELDFITLNQHNISGATYTVVLDETTGSKVMKLEASSEYPGFVIKNRRKSSAMPEFLTFDFRFESTTGNYYTMYVGNDHTGSNQKFSLARSTSWQTSGILQGNTANNVIGGFFNNTFNGVSKGNYVIYFDNITYWSVPEGSATEEANKVTFTFANSTGAPTNVTLPEAYTGTIWTAGANTTVDLTKLTATDNDGLYRFIGWSKKDGGAVISSKVSAYPVIKNETLYAVWEKIQPVVKVEDFEAFEVGTVVTSANFDFLNINQHGIDGVTATIVLDEKSGSKVLKLTSEKRYAGFALKNRATVADTAEYLEFDFRFDTDDGSRFMMYAGTDHTGGNHKGEATRGTEWSYYHLNSNTSYKTAGGYFDDGTDGKGNFTIYIDNVYYWVVPAGTEADEDNNVTFTFANSTTNAPAAATVTLPESKTMAIWTVADQTYIDLNKFIPTTTDASYEFAGWSRTDGGKVMSARYGHFNFVRDETLYAVWNKLAAPELNGKTSIRSEGVAGIRFQASAASTITAGNDVEIGFLVTRAVNYTTDEALKLENKTVEGVTKIVSGTAYSKKDGTELINKLTLEDTGNYLFSAVLINIPESKANYTEELYIRPYVTINGTTFYGAVAHKSLYQAALDFCEGDEAITSYVERIIEICEA